MKVRIVDEVSRAKLPARITILDRASGSLQSVGDVSLEGKDDVLASVLVDLSQNASLSASLDVGSHVIREMGKIAKMHRKTVKQAGFLVLKSPDMPSILVETAFISNPEEERKLRDKRNEMLL